MNQAFSKIVLLQGHGVSQTHLVLEYYIKVYAVFYAPVSIDQGVYCFTCVCLSAENLICELNIFL